MSESHATTSVFLSCAAARRPAASPATPTPVVTRKSRRLTRAPMCVPPKSVISSDQKKMFFDRSRYVP